MMSFGNIHNVRRFVAAIVRKPLIGSLCVLAAIGGVLAPADVSAQIPFEVVHSFDDRGFLQPPLAAATQASDGGLYVTAVGGGSRAGTVLNQGMIFRVNLDGSLTILHAFSGGVDGATPYGAVVQATDGMFYGTASRGGAHGLGVVFRMHADGTLNTSRPRTAISTAPPTGAVRTIAGRFSG
jgi:uncharacterized repeat protein (TIGR03803 family)